MADIRGRRFIVTSGGGNPNPDPTGNTMSFAINFAEPPTGVTLTIPKYKFDKKSHLAIEWDDGAMRGEHWGKDHNNDPVLIPANPVLVYMNSLKYTDGCGNAIGYKGAIAINCGTGQFGDEGYNPDFLQEPEMRDIINKGWDFCNHGMVHGPSPTAYDDTIRLDNLIKHRVNYSFNTTVVPTNFTGYTQAAYDLGYVMCTSQGDITGDAWRNIRVHQQMPTLNTEPVFIFVIRDFNDEWASTDSISNLKGEIDKFATGQRDFERIGTHNPLTNTDDLNGFKDLFNYVYATTNDNTIVCSTREFLEYRQMALQPITQQVVGNQLIVTINIDNLSDRNRWRDLSFKAAGGIITGVEAIEGINSIAYNVATGLVNIFNQKTVWL